LRKELLNGNKMRMLSALKGEQYRKNLWDTIKII
jgi:hypothetical protein